MSDWKKASQGKLTGKLAGQDSKYKELRTNLDAYRPRQGYDLWYKDDGSVVISKVKPVGNMPSPNAGDELGRVTMVGKKSNDKTSWATLNRCATVKSSDSEREEREREEHASDIHVKSRGQGER